MSTLPKIHVVVESAPHNENLNGAMLTRPAPNGGAFLIDQRVERRIWDQMKAAGAWYYSADDLEDFDMFDSEPGWRYNIEALRVLLRNGFTLRIRGEDVATVERLDAMFSPEGQAEYKARRAAEKAEKERKAEEERQRKEREREEKAATYEAWKAERIGGLVKTYAGPRFDAVDWQRIAFFDSDTPGTWYTTGDAWYQATVDGETVYRCDYGNATVFYAPQSLVDQWCERKYQELVARNGGEPAAALHLLQRALPIIEDGRTVCIGDDIYVRLVTLHGIDHYAEIARGGPARLFDYNAKVWDYSAERIRQTNGYLADTQKIADRFGIEVRYMHMLPHPGREARDRLEKNLTPGAGIQGSPWLDPADASIWVCTHDLTTGWHNGAVRIADDQEQYQAMSD